MFLAADVFHIEAPNDKTESDDAGHGLLARMRQPNLNHPLDDGVSQRVPRRFGVVQCAPRRSVAPSAEVLEVLQDCVLPLGSRQ